MSSQSDTYYSSVLLALTTVFFWSLSAPGAKFVHTEANYLGLALVRLGCGVIVFGAWLWYDWDNCQDQLRELVNDGRNRSVYSFAATVFFFGVFLLIYDVTFFFSIQEGPSIPANVINYLWPLFFPALGGVVFRRSDSKFGWFELGVLLLAFSGAALIASNSASTLASNIEFTYILAFVAALSAAVYMNLLSVAQKIVDSTPFIFFVAVSIATVMELIAVLTTGLEIHINASSIPFVLLFGFTTFGFAQLAWGKAISLGEDVLISSLAYMTPILSTVFLHMFVDAPITETIAFGAVLIIVAQVLLNDTFHHMTSLSGALITIFLSALFLYIDPSVLGAAPSLPQLINLIGPIFAILTGFMLNRVWETNHKENEKLTQINFRLKRLIELVDRHDLPEDDVERVYDSIQALFIAIIDLNYARNSKSIGPSMKEVGQRLNETAALVTELTPAADSPASDVLESLEVEVTDWIMLSQERVSRGEMIIMILLGLATMLALILNAGDAFVPKLITIGLNGAIVFIILKIRDYTYNRAGDPTKILFEQQVLEEIDRPLYFPREEFTYTPAVAELTDDDQVIKVGDKDEDDFDELPTISSPGISKTVRYTVLLLVLAAIAMIVGLLYVRTV